MSIRLQDERGFRGDGCGDHARGGEAAGRVWIGGSAQTCPASDLIVGLQCGGSDAFSGVTCNPAVGYAADLLVRAGATVMFSEVTEVRDAVHLLTPRAATPEVARDLIREMRWYDEYLARGEPTAAPTRRPATSAAGWRTSSRRRWARVAKAGSTALRGRGRATARR